MTSKNIRLLKTLRSYEFGIAYDTTLLEYHTSIPSSMIAGYITIYKHDKAVITIYGERALDLCLQMFNFQQQLISENNDKYVLKKHALLLLCYFNKIFTVCIENDSLEDF